MIRFKMIFSDINLFVKYHKLKRIVQLKTNPAEYSQQAGGVQNTSTPLLVRLEILEIPSMSFSHHC